MNGRHRKAREGRTGSSVDVVLAFRPQIRHSLIVLVSVLHDVGDVRQRRVRVGELEEVDDDDGIVVAVRKARSVRTRKIRKRESAHEMLNALSDEEEVDRCEFRYPLDVVDAVDVGAGLQRTHG